MSTAVVFLFVAGLMMQAAEVSIGVRHARSPDILNMTCACHDVEENTNFTILCMDSVESTTMSCYRFVREPKNFTEARRGCCKQGGHLVYIETTEERRFIRSKISEDNWVGFNGTVWLDGTTRNNDVFTLNCDPVLSNCTCFQVGPQGQGNSNGNSQITISSAKCNTTSYSVCEIPYGSERPLYRGDIDNCRPTDWNVNDFCNCSDEVVTSPEPNQSDLVPSGTRETTVSRSTGRPASSTDTADTDAIVETTQVDYSAGKTDGVNTPNGKPSTGSPTSGDDSNSELTTVDNTLLPGQRQSGGPIGIPVGITLAAIVILVALVAFYLWRKRGNNRGAGEKPRGSGFLMTGEDEAKSHIPGVNPTYGYQENGHVADVSLQPVTTSGLTNKDPTSFDDSPDYTPYPNTEASDSYAVIPPNGYAAYKHQQENDMYTTLTGFEDIDGDDPDVYTPIPNNGGAPEQSSDSEYVVPEPAVGPSVKRHGASGVGASDPRPLGQDSGRIQVKNSGYVDVDAPQSLGGLYMDLDNNPQGRQATRDGEYTYVSVENRPATISDSQEDEEADGEGDYYFKLEKPGPDDSGQGTYSESNEGAPGENGYDTFSRAGAQRPGKNAPTDEGTYNLPGPTDGNTYNTFNRTGNQQPKANGPTPDGGVYSLPGAPTDDVYSTLN